MTFTIPSWILWTMGVALGIVILFLAIIGAVALWWVIKLDGNLGWMK